MANHNMKDSLKEIVGYMNDNILLPEIDEELLDNKVDIHADQLVTDVGGVHGLHVTAGATPKIEYQKPDETWEEISLGSETLSDADIADIKAAFDTGLAGS